MVSGRALRVIVEPTATSGVVRQPVLACAWRNDSEERARSLRNYEEQAGYVTSEIIPGHWMLLAPRSRNQTRCHW